jgi:hypothetical protein
MRCLLEAFFSAVIVSSSFAQSATPVPPASPEVSHAKLVPFPADRMSAFAISPRVNGPRNNDERILKAIVADLNIPGEAIADLAQLTRMKVRSVRNY